MKLTVFLLNACPAVPKGSVLRLPRTSWSGTAALLTISTYTFPSPTSSLTDFAAFTPWRRWKGCGWRTSRRAPPRRRSGCCSRAILAWGAAWSVRTPTTSRRAWDPIGNGRNSARAIFGVFYGGISGNSWNQAADPSRSPPGGSSATVHSLANPYADMGGKPSPYVFNPTSPRFAPRVVLAVRQRDHQWVQLREHQEPDDQHELVDLRPNDRRGRHAAGSARAASEPPIGRQCRDAPGSPGRPSSKARKLG